MHLVNLNNDGLFKAVFFLKTEEITLKLIYFSVKRNPVLPYIDVVDIILSTN